MKALRRVSSLLIAATLTALICSCGTDRTSLVIYSPHGREMLSAYKERYEAAHPHVNIQWFSMGAEVGLERLRAERANPQADLWWGGPATIFEQGEREGLLDPYAPSWREYAAPGSFSESDAWYSTFLSVKVIGYNDEVLSPEQAPQDWDDILDERWRDKVIIRSPMESGTMKSVFAAMMYRKNRETGSIEAGYDWLRKLDRNTKAYAASPATLMLMLSRREGLVTLWDLTDILLQRREQNVPVSYRIPTSGAVVLNEGIAVVKNASNRELAIDFYEFVTSAEELRWQAEHFYRVPARTDILTSELPDWLQELEYRELPLDWEEIGRHREDWMRFWDQNIKNRG